MYQQLLGIIKLVMTISPDAAQILIASIRPNVIQELNNQIAKEFQILDEIVVPSMYDVERINDLTLVRNLIGTVNE